MGNIRRQRVFANSSEQWYGTDRPENARIVSKETARTKHEFMESTHYDS
jgi:hypothetical protein